MTKKIKAWHFLPKSRTLGYGDGREVRPGETLTHEGDIELCYSGLHASKTALDALRYEKGPIVCRVELSGTVIEGPDKCVATERTVLWMADATEVLCKFARLCALDVVHLWDCPRPVLSYLKTGKGNERSARDAHAAADAAYAAGAYAAASAASAAYAAAAYAAAYAAHAAASAAHAADAYAAAYAAHAADARTKLRAKQNRRIICMLNKLEQ